jgi:predicted transcriptional regulator/rubrerythrin
MSKGVRSGARWVSIAQMLVARELVENLGVSTRRAADLLGLAPSAVSQYLGGKRRESLLDDFGARPEITTIAHRIAVALAETRKDADPPARIVLEGAARMAEEAGEKGDRQRSRAGAPRIDRPAIRRLRERVGAEQAAVTSCMRLAQKARDELTRAIFRQIASDSLRHAEIVASMEIYLESGTNRSLASGIDRSDVEALIRQEHEAEGKGGDDLRTGLGGVMKILVQSMADDEEKHERLLEGLLKEGFPK